MATKPKKQASYDLKAADRKRNLAIQIGLTSIVVIFAVVLVGYIVLSNDKKPQSGEAKSVRVASNLLVQEFVLLSSPARLRPLARPPAPCTRTCIPSATLMIPSVTTRWPGRKPARISTRPPRCAPVRTGTRRTRPPGPSANT